MKIQLGGEVLMNKTKKYLAPCLKKYGEEFEKRFHSVWKVAIGIGDIIILKSGINLEKHIFILCDAGRGTKAFCNFIDWVKEQEMFEQEYAFDDIKTGQLHMVVIKLPEECYETFETFKRSEFSKMYTPEDVIKYISDSEVKGALIKDHEYKLKFSKILQEQYEVKIHPEEFGDDFELEFPLVEAEEVFNTEIK